MKTWIGQAAARFGEPSIAFPEPIIRAGMNRRCWVWFVDGQNFNVAIDEQTGGRFKTTAGSPGRHGYLYTDGDPADTEIRALLAFCWPGFAEAADV